MGNRDQFFTTCKRCRRQILMTWSPTKQQWIPCDPELRRYKQTEDGTETFISPDGETCRGERAFDGEYGYRRHRKDCALI